MRLFLQALFSGDGSIYHSDTGIFLEYYSKSRRLIEDVHHLLLRFGIFSLIREKTTAIGTRACKIQITDKDQILRFASRVGFSPGSVKQRLLEEKVLPMIAAQSEAQEQLRFAAPGGLGDRRRRGTGWRTEFELARHSRLVASIHADICRRAGCPHDR